MSAVPDILKDIEEALTDNDFEKLAKLAHKLKGSSGTLNINEIFEMASFLEQCAISKEEGNCKDTVLKIKMRIS